MVNSTKCPKLVLLLLLAKLVESQEEHVQSWRIQSQKLVTVILSLFNLLPRILHGHCKHIDRFCQFCHVYSFVSCCHESFAFKICQSIYFRCLVGRFTRGLLWRKFVCIFINALGRPIYLKILQKFLLRRKYKFTITYGVRGTAR